MTSPSSPSSISPHRPTDLRRKSITWQLPSSQVGSPTTSTPTLHLVPENNDFELKPPTPTSPSPTSPKSQSGSVSPLRRMSLSRSISSYTLPLRRTMSGSSSVSGISDAGSENSQWRSRLGFRWRSKSASSGLNIAGEVLSSNEYHERAGRMMIALKDAIKSIPFSPDPSLDSEARNRLSKRYQKKLDRLNERVNNYDTSTFDQASVSTSLRRLELDPSLQNYLPDRRSKIGKPKRVNDSIGFMRDETSTIWNRVANSPLELMSTDQDAKDNDTLLNVEKLSSSISRFNRAVQSAEISRDIVAFTDEFFNEHVGDIQQLNRAGLKPGTIHDIWTAIEEEDTKWNEYIGSLKKLQTVFERAAEESKSEARRDGSESLRCEEGNEA